ncbi:MAG: DNA adenine methylase [Urechidicola sp.]|nr:DNA adenine methylase [Urechidicola sp.]
MRFIGNKERLVDWIHNIIQEKELEGNIFFDFFSGTSNVGKHFKSKDYQIISSDLLYFSFVLQNAYLVNNKKPLFEKLLNSIEASSNLLFSDNFDLVIEYLNKTPLVKGFIYQNYTPDGTSHLEKPRMYFISENAQKIDAIRLKIEEWKTKKLITKNEYFILLACLIECVPFFSNILGVYAAFKKDWDVRALKPLKLKRIQLIESNKKHFAYNKSSMELLQSHKYDIIYLDPPYNQRQYAPNYHILETIAKYDNPEIKGVSGMRNYDNQKSDFCNKIRALNSLEEIVKSNNYKYIVLSYNNEGIMPQEKILEIMEKQGSVEIVEYDYLRFKSNNNGLSKTKKYIKEQLYILKNKA